MPLLLRRVGIGAREAPAPVGELRVARPHLLAVEHASRRRPRSARVRSDVRSLPAPGSLNSWHQISDASRIFGSQRAFCSSVPCASSVGPTRLTPMRPTSSGARAARQLLGDDVVLDRARAAPAVLLAATPTPTQPAARELRLPLAPERDLLGEVVEARRQALAVLPRQVRAQPGADLVAERVLGGGGGEVHRRSLSTACGSVWSTSSSVGPRHRFRSEDRTTRGGYEQRRTMTNPCGVVSWSNSGSRDTWRAPRDRLARHDRQRRRGRVESWSTGDLSVHVASVNRLAMACLEGHQQVTAGARPRPNSAKASPRLSGGV